MKRIISLALLFVISMSVGIGYADGDGGIYSTNPDAEELERQKQYKLPPIEAWEVDLEGNVEEVPPRTKGTIKKYRGGSYGGGSLRYKKYSPSGTSFLGYYYETGNGWSVSPTTTFTYTESSL
ncbi:MAG: hypothetical protein FH761_10680 [Firmicutes bacterium]|nr:hypothetical protein [Bacillota bacterium]